LLPTIGTMPTLQTNGQANRGGAAVVHSCDDWWEQLQSHNRHRSFVSEELADNIAALGRITKTRRQVRLADGRCGGIDGQLELEVKFDNKQVTMILLILPGVVDPLVLGWNFLKQVGTEIRCAGHGIIIPAGNRHNGGEAISSSRSTSKRVGRYYSVP